VIALLVAAVACSGDCRAQNLFQQMERKLLSGLLQLEVTSHAEGAVQADATTDVSVGPATRLHSQGTFLGKPFARSFDERTTPGLRDAVVLGMTRMGLLHNVVNLSQGNGIDYADGSARDWLKATTFRRVKGGVSFLILVGDKEIGSATLLIDAKTKLPRKRTQVVHLPNADMHVTETYRFPAKQ
jgi:hypothetical protein